MKYKVYQQRMSFTNHLMVAKGEVPASTVDQVLEQVFMMYNDPDVCMGNMYHSISVGDIVVVEGHAYSRSSQGWLPLL